MIQKASPHDVIVIGSGGGGLRAAIGAAQAGARTLVISRGKANRSGATLLAGANISADIACDGSALAMVTKMIHARHGFPTCCMKDSFSITRNWYRCLWRQRPIVW